MVQVEKCLNNGKDKDQGKDKNLEICLKKKIYHQWESRWNGKGKMQ